MKLVFEGSLIVDIEDGGQAMIAELDTTSETNTDGHIFAKLQSWDKEKEHPILNLLRQNKRIRITVEVLS